MKRTTLLVLAVLFANAMVSHTYAAKPQGKTKNEELRTASPRPNVIFIAIDDLNDWTGIY